MIWLAALLGLAAGFALGRTRLDSLVSWAEAWTAPGPRGWRFWPAFPVILAALAWLWIRHPRRTLANVRSWQAGERLHPAPVRDPDWAAKRRAATEDQNSETR
ncbi:hypothetical protein ACFV0T_26325 [Streptomyces sp. NPDC059582]|uniref:hypothetical protein n=1 Tax=Streptomyces sp. NPDC059582 TaxID=3346875 RepID=UPI0036905EA6